VSNGRCNDVGYFSRLFYCGIVDLEVTYGSSRFSLIRLIICQIFVVGVKLLSLETYDNKSILLSISFRSMAVLNK